MILKADGILARHNSLAFRKESSICLQCRLLTKFTGTAGSASLFGLVWAIRI